MLDVLIITAVRDEYEAVLQVSETSAENKWRVVSKPDKREVQVRSFKAQNGKLLRIGVSYARDMGGIATAEIAVRLTQQYKPQCLAMCGVLAGRKGKVNQRDVIIADRLWIYDNGKVIASYDENQNRQEKILRDVLRNGISIKWTKSS